MPHSLEFDLIQRTVDGKLFRTIENSKRIECFACAHRCKIADGKSGICNIRYNIGGRLKVPYGYVAAFQCDPIEKKPFFHAYPKSLAMSFGMLGCDLKCSYCQNWDISQALRDARAGRPPRDITVSDFIETALRLKARVVVSTYNEPLITSEWAMDIFQEAKKEGFATGYVSNGNATEEVLDFIRPHTDLYKVDLKSFRDRKYRDLGANLDKVLNAINLIYKKGFWLELVTLLVPGFNDSKEEIKDMAEFIHGISPDIPWHLSAYHRDYKMTDARNTSSRDLIQAAKIGKDVGLNYIYAGNLLGKIDELENTRCPNCQSTLVERYGFEVTKYDITDEGKCPSCLTKIAGVWEKPKLRENLFYFFR